MVAGGRRGDCVLSGRHCRCRRFYSSRRRRFSSGIAHQPDHRARPRRRNGARMNLVNHNAGFSLVEVMVAILILGIALVGLTQGITTALSSSKESELQTVAALFAAGQIETLRAEKDLADGTGNGDCGAVLPLYRWKQTVSPTDIGGLHDVDVVVENTQTGVEIYELKTLLFAIPDDSSGKTKKAKPKTNRP